MTFSGHIAVGSMTLQMTHNPLIAFVVCYLLHFLTDAIPHAEYFSFADRPRVRVAVIAIDTLLMLGLIAQLYLYYSPEYLLVSACVLGSIFPDLTDGLTKKFVPMIRKFHVAVHAWPESSKEPIKFGIRP